MNGNGSLGYWYQYTGHYSSNHPNDDGISGDVNLGVSAGDGRRGFRSQDTSHSSSCNREFYLRGDKNGDGVRGGYISQDTSHYSS